MRYRKKPIEVEAIKTDGTWKTIIEWLDSLGAGRIPLGMKPRIVMGGDGTVNVMTVDSNDVVVPIGAYIVIDSKGYPYPCDAEIFEANHDPIEN